MAKGSYFTPATFRYLEELAEHNTRSWFQANKARYDEQVREPALRLILDFAPRLAG